MDQKLNDLLIILCRSIANRKVYDGKHPKIIQHIEDFINALHSFFTEINEDTLFIGIVDDNIVYKGRNLAGPSIIGRQLVAFAEKLNCGGITFSRNVSRAEVGALFDLVSDLHAPLQSIQESRELLQQKGITNIQIAHHYSAPSSPVLKEKRKPWQGKDSGQLLQSPSLIYQALFDVVSSAHGNASAGRSLDIDTTKSVSEYLLQHTRNNFSDMMQHIHYPDFDTYTVGHSVRVATLAVFAGIQMDIPDKTLLELGTAGLLHDVGKSKIPEEILYKPGKLSQEEFTIIQSHSRLGAEILLAQDNTTELDIAAAWGHHIKYNGQGYPEHPSWAIQHPLTSLLQICDVFEALTAIRPYKLPMTPLAAFTIMLNDEGAFHPAVLASFISAIGLYPPGNTVLLSDGSKGRVVEAGAKIDKPRIEITHDRNGIELPESDILPIDLNRQKTERLSVSELLLN